MARPRSIRHRVSQADVAKAAGVSTGIVSSVINNKSYGSIRVSDATRARVLAAVEELGYVPNLAARSMAGGTNRLIGVFTYESVFPMGTQSFYHEFLVGIEEAADEAEHNLLLVTGSRRSNRRSIFASGVNQLRLADGGLLLGSSEDQAEIARLARERYPFVVVGERQYRDVEASYSAADYVAGTAALVTQAHEVGHRRIAFLQTHIDPVPGRLAGFDQARETLGLTPATAPIIVVRSAPDGDEERVREVADDIIASGATCIVVQGGSFLADLWAELTNRGLVLPRDLSVIGLRGEEIVVGGFDLTEIAIPRYEMGHRAVGLLLTLIADPDAAPLRERLACGIRDGQTLVPPPPTSD